MRGKLFFLNFISVAKTREVMRESNCTLLVIFLYKIWHVSCLHIIYLFCISTYIRKFFTPLFQINQNDS